MDTPLYELLGSGITLLTASRRLAYRLRLEYAQAAQGQGLTVWPTPAILPWSTYLLEACRAQRDAAARAPRLLSELQTLTLWEHIVAESEFGTRLLNPTLAARNALRSWQLLHQYRIPLASVAESYSEEARVFAGWAQCFVELTAQRHWLDQARLPEWLLATDHVPDSTLRLSGFDELTPQMQQLIAHWRKRGCDVESLQVTAPNAEVQVVAAQSPQQELDLAARWARHQVEAGRSRVAVVMSDVNIQAAQIRRAFTRVFIPEAQRIGHSAPTPAFTLAASAPLNDYAVVHHAMLLLQLAQGSSDILLVGQLLRSPFIAGYEEEVMTRSLAELAARESRRERWDVRELERFAGARGCMQLSHCLQRMASLTAAGKALASEWAERFSVLLREAGWPMGRALDSAELQTVMRFREVLAELSALDEVLGRINGTQALSYLRAGCIAARFAPESDEQAVTIIDVDTVSGMRFDALWVMGLHAGEWPAAPQPDPFLPLDLQRRHGMPQASAERCLEQGRHRLQRLVGSAEQVMLSWPQHDDDAELQPSALLQPYAVVEALQLPQSTVQSVAQALYEQRPALERFSDEHAPALSPGAVRGGTRSLELQSRCPFKAQAQMRLHAEEVPRISPAVEPTERGKLIHRMLTDFWLQLRDSHSLQQMSEAEWASRLRDIAERVAVREMPATTPHRRRMVDIEIELAVQWIMALLRVEAQRMPFTVRQLEQREPFEFAGMRINIQLDRIDELADGSWLLIDYKTGGANQSRDWLDISVPNRPHSPQLPLYALAHQHQLAGISYAVLCPDESAYRGLASRGDVAPGIDDYAARAVRFRIPGVDDWDALLRHWNAVLQTLAAGYLGGDARVDPLKGECDYCHLAGLCRVNELRERRDIEEEEGGAGDD